MTTMKWFRYAVIETTATPPQLKGLYSNRRVARIMRDLAAPVTPGKFVVRRVKIIPQES